MKKFYKEVSTAKCDDGYPIRLDGKTMKTPLGKELIAPSKPLADAIVKEWDNQGRDIDIKTMPMTQILNAAIDKKPSRKAITKTLTKYLDTDLLCYRVKEPADLAKLQKTEWDKWLDWFYGHFEVPLESTTGLNALKQSDDAHKRVWAYIESQDDYYFTVLEAMTSLTGSVVLGLCFLEGEITPEEMFNAARLDELYKSKLYNEGKYGTAPNVKKSREEMKRDIAASKRFLELLNE